MAREIFGVLEVHSTSLEATIEKVELLDEEWHEKYSRQRGVKCYKITLLISHPADSSKKIKKEEWPVREDSLTPENSAAGNKIDLDAVEYGGKLYDVTCLPWVHGQKYSLQPLFDEVEPIMVYGDLEIK